MKLRLFHIEMRRRRCGGKEGGIRVEGSGRAASALLKDVLEAAKWGPLESCGCRGADRRPVVPPGPGGTRGVLVRARWPDPKVWDPDKPMSGERKARVPALWWPGHEPGVGCRGGTPNTGG